MARLMRRKKLSGTPEEILAAVRQLPPGHRYFVDIIRLDPPPSPEELDRLREELKDRRTPEEIQADRERILAASRPPRPLPPGKTLADVIREFRERNPDDTHDTDEEIEDALEEMS
jgi:hypothetical protein